VLERPATARVPKTPLLVESAVEEVVQDPSGALSWFSWVGLTIAALGTLAMGTVLPFWLVSLAQQAAASMLK
jgi:NADH-quinone oxidoreductase subunit N